MKRFNRVLILVLDGVGVGEMPDAANFGDRGSDTLGHVAEFRPLDIPRLERLGIGNIRPLPNIPPAARPTGCHGKAALASHGKDSTCGHWEMMGIILKGAFPTYPTGFPAAIMERFEGEIGRQTLGNYPASGTQIILELGEEHLETGSPIVYTSADSVFQVAAHENVVPPEELHQICQTARRILRGKHQVGRVIARPFTGKPGSFTRTAGRKDYAIPPPLPTVLDRLQESGVPVTAVGKIASIYCHRGIDQELKSINNRDTCSQTLAAMEDFPQGLIFSNFVDFDMVYGHRNNVEGFAMALEEFDTLLGDILERLGNQDLLIITSDHGCDPSTPSTDHSREYALLLAFSLALSGDVSLGVRKSLADIGATVAENFSAASPAGNSFLGQLGGG